MTNLAESPVVKANPEAILKILQTLDEHTAIFICRDEPMIERVKKGNGFAYVVCLKGKQVQRE